LELIFDPNLIVGFDKADDAGVYKITDDIALIQTVDFFTPIVDDPYCFGQIAAANALSDVYAMGGRPLCAMNIVGFPAQTMDISVLHNILRGGLDKLREANTTLAGGHTVEDPELKYGLSVTGIVHPEKVVTNQGARPGDILVLTKPLGTGIVNTAIKAELASAEATAEITASMVMLNRAAADVMARFTVHACTDITGFGLVGHITEMVAGSDVAAIVNASRLPHFASAREYAAMGLLPAGLHRNREYCESSSIEKVGVPLEMADLLYDPQTSGGLLIAAPAEQGDELLSALHDAGVTAACVVGSIDSSAPGKVIITP
jgi:selenide, water dikinase